MKVPSTPKVAGWPAHAHLFTILSLNITSAGREGGRRRTRPGMLSRRAAARARRESLIALTASRRGEPACRCRRDGQPLDRFGSVTLPGPMRSRGRSSGVRRYEELWAAAAPYASSISTGDGQAIPNASLETASRSPRGTQRVEHRLANCRCRAQPDWYLIRGRSKEPEPSRHWRSESVHRTHRSRRVRRCPPPRKTSPRCE